MIASSADVSADALLAPTAKVWHLAQVREGASLGEHVIVGRGAYIGTGVSIGSNTKIQNYALVYEPAEIGPGVFIGPAAVLTNDRVPRAINPDGSQKHAEDWELVGVKVGEGASIGARAVCVAPLTVGAWAMIAAGAVVTCDVPAFGLMVGVPARRIGWVGRTGERLVVDHDVVGLFRCPASGDTYLEADGVLAEGTL